MNSPAGADPLLSPWLRDASPGPVNECTPFAREEIEHPLAERFERMVAANPEHPAVEWCGRSWTYGQLNAHANRVARAILAARPGLSNPVALLAGHGYTQAVGLLAVLKAGGAYVPMSPADPADRAAETLGDCNADLIVTDSIGLAAARALARPGISVVDVEACPATLVSGDLRRPVAPDALGAVFYTSGSEGRPKGVMYSHRNLLHHAWCGVQELRICARDRLAGATYFPTVVATAGMLRALLAGATLCPYDVHTQGIALLAQWLAEMRITLFRSTPTFFRNLVTTLTGAEDLSRLRVYSLGGEAILKQDVDLYQRHFPDGCLLRTGLGLTEAGGGVTGLFLHTRTQVLGPSLPAGYPLPDMETRIMDDNGREAAIGEAGEIVLRSQSLSLGYWRRPELTAERFATDPACPGMRTFRTGDLGRRLPDGCLVHLGRKDLMVKVRGMRVELPEVEAALLSVPGVRQAAVTLRPSVLGNQRLVACLVTNPDTTPTVSRIIAHLAQRLPRHMVPSAFVFLPALPTTPAGKLDRRALPDPATERPSLDVEFWADRNPAENRLRVIWERVLGVHPIGVKDQFFELGGDSLAAARLMAEIAEEFHQDLPGTVLLEAPTIEALAGRLLGENWEAPQAPVVALQTGGRLPPLFCVEALNAGQFIHLARRLGPQQPVYGLHPLMRRRPRTVEGLARAYVAEVRRRQPEGPYQLCGLCAGGTVAFEMARQLRAQGQAVSFIGLLDAFVPRRRVLPLVLDRLMRRLLTRGERRARRRAAGAQPAAEVPPPSAYARRMAAAFGALRRANRRALHRYRPGRYPGRVVLFLAESTTITPRQGERTAWAGLADGGADLHTVPGMHETMLHEPHVAVLAERLRPYLRV